MYQTMCGQKIYIYKENPKEKRMRERERKRKKAVAHVHSADKNVHSTLKLAAIIK